MLGLGSAATVHSASVGLRTFGAAGSQKGCTFVASTSLLNSNRAASSVCGQGSVALKVLYSNARPRLRLRRARVFCSSEESTDSEEYDEDDADNAVSRDVNTVRYI